MFLCLHLYIQICGLLVNIHINIDMYIYSSIFVDIPCKSKNRLFDWFFREKILCIVENPKHYLCHDIALSRCIQYRSHPTPLCNGWICQDWFLNLRWNLHHATRTLKQVLFLSHTWWWGPPEHIVWMPHGCHTNTMLGTVDLKRHEKIFKQSSKRGHWLCIVIGRRTKCVILQNLYIYNIYI